MTHIAIFASGTGTNAQSIMEYFKNSSTVKIGLLVSNKADAPVLKIAAEYKVPTLVISKQNLAEVSFMTAELDYHRINFVVLAGFLLKIPSFLVKKFPNAMTNIHPSLLPRHGGKGMYGMKVHEAVVANKDRQSGITIHWVNDQYDEGAIIYQETCDILPTDTPEIVSAKVRKIELAAYPRVLEGLLV
jgi:phosphoribosylglycinamide formyltransferase-1